MTPYYLKIQRWWRGARVRFMLGRWTRLSQIRMFWVHNRLPGTFIDNTAMN